jgi:hypothetical protein
MEDEGQVRVTEVGEGMSSTVDLVDLRASWRSFALDVREFIVKEFPDVLDEQNQVGVFFRDLERLY